MKNLFLVVLGIITTSPAANAQKTPVTLLENMIKATKTSGVISYNIKSTDKNPFSQNDTTWSQSGKFGYVEHKNLYVIEHKNLEQIEHPYLV